MREQLRGYVAAVLGVARESGRLGALASELKVLADAVMGNRSLYDVMCDGALGVANRSAVLIDLLSAADPLTRRLASELVALEREGEVPPSLEWLAGRATDELAASEGSEAGALVDPPAGRSGAKARLEGFAKAVFEDLSERSVVDEVEDELFRFARTIEGTRELGALLTDQAVAVEARQRVAADLLARAQVATARLVAYTIAATRARELVEMLDWLVDRAAAERGLRVAQVTSAVSLDGAQQARLAAALGRLTGRTVELRLSLDPSLIGGMAVVVGDTIIDGTLRHRLDRLRVELASGSEQTFTRDRREP